MSRYEMYVDTQYTTMIASFKAWPSKARETAERIARKMGGRVAWHTLRECSR